MGEWNSSSHKSKSNSNGNNENSRSIILLVVLVVAEIAKGRMLAPFESARSAVPLKAKE